MTEQSCQGSWNQQIEQKKLDFEVLSPFDSALGRPEDRHYVGVGVGLPRPSRPTLIAVWNSFPREWATNPNQKMTEQSCQVSWNQQIE
jgi:hypothetical protein